MLLPSRLSSEISTEVVGVLQSSAHRLVYRTDGAMKAPAVATSFNLPLMQLIF